jgi:hypothetical protein
MSELGQKAKYSLRADVFRFGPNNGHRSTGSACPFGADIVAKVFLGDKTKFSRTADAFRMCRFEDLIVSKRKRPDSTNRSPSSRRRKRSGSLHQAF